MKKLLASLMALVLVVLSVILPASATLANSSLYTRYGSSGTFSDFYGALITATANDTTANADSNVIVNTNNDIRSIAAGVKATNQTGTSPTLTVQLLGAFDAAGPWIVAQTKQGSTAGTTANVASSALSISTASTTAVATGFDTFQFGLEGINYPYLKIRIVVGGSSTPGWTGVAYAIIKRQYR